MKKVAIIGTVGIPAKYGGFETLVENIIGKNQPGNISYTVYCSAKSYVNRPTHYKQAQLKYIPLKANGAQSIPYDIISILSALRKHDTLLILGVSGCIILPIIKLISRKRIIVNIDGLEHKRDKWGSVVKKFLKWSEKLAIKYADVIITDNKAIQDYVTTEYNTNSTLIAYGGNHVTIPAKVAPPIEEFSFGLCRIEPENNVHVILEAFSNTTQKLIYVGNWKNSQYGINLVEKYSTNENIELLDPIYDLDVLGQYRSQCRYYIHGHSAGGTNPSLVEAMFFRKPIIAFDVSYNRESTESCASYFTNSEHLQSIINSNKDLSENAESMYSIAQRRYCWHTIVQQYEELY